MKKITDPDFKYTPAVATDILKRFRAAGWTPPSELRPPVFTDDDLAEANTSAVERLQGTR